MTLRQYAYLVAAPRDLVINIGINGFLFWLGLWDESSLRLFTPNESPSMVPSLMALLGPMAVLLPGLVTFFGYFNGVKFRWVAGREPAWVPGTRWFWTAVRQEIKAAVYGVTVWAVLFALGRWLFPTASVPARPAVVVIALGSGIAAYILQVRAVLKSGDL